jgi:hypothetical protein
MDLASLIAPFQGFPLCNREWFKSSEINLKQKPTTITSQGNYVTNTELMNLCSEGDTVSKL